MGVIYLIEDDHHRVYPTCTQRTGGLQVLNEKALENVSPEERINVLQKFGLEARV